MSYFTTSPTYFITLAHYFITLAHYFMYLVMYFTITIIYFKHIIASFVITSKISHVYTYKNEFYTIMQMVLTNIFETCCYMAKFLFGIITFRHKTSLNYLFIFFLATKRITELSPT